MESTWSSKRLPGNENSSASSSGSQAARSGRCTWPASNLADAIDIRVILSRSGLMPVIPLTRDFSSSNSPMAVPASSTRTWLA